MSEVEKRAYILADNKLAENADWDEDLLAEELSFLLDEGDEIDIDVTGFSIAEIDMVLESGGTVAQTETQREDSLPVWARRPSPLNISSNRFHPVAI